MDDEACDTCRFWEMTPGLKRADGTVRGYCRRESPRLYDPDEHFARWPITDADDWCGEHDPRKDVTPGELGGSPGA